MSASTIKLYAVVIAYTILTIGFAAIGSAYAFGGLGA